MTDSGDRGRQEFVKELQLALSPDDIREIYIDSAQSLVPSDGFGIYQFASDPLHPPIEKASNLSDSFLENYEKSGRADDPVLEFILKHMLPGDSSRLAPELWLGSSARAVLAREGLEHSLEAPITEAGQVIGTINFARAEDARSFTWEDLSTARFVSEHMSLALERARRFEALGERAAILEGALERSPHGVLVTGLDGESMFGNRHALELLGDSRERGSRLLELVEEAIEDFIVTDGHAATVNVRDSLTGRSVAVRSYRDVRREAVVSLVYEMANAETSTLPAWGVLSPREQEIATFVSQGLTTKEIAAQAFISENTVKQHLKRIFGKTGVHSRAELVQTIWSSRPEATA